MNTQPFDFKFPDKIDLRVVLAFVSVCLVILIVVVGDLTTFRRQPDNWMEAICAFFPTVGYMMMRVRIGADIVAAGISGGLILGTGLWLYKIAEKYVIIPQHVREMLRKGKLEEDALNRMQRDD